MTKPSVQGTTAGVGLSATAPVASAGVASVLVPYLARQRATAENRTGRANVPRPSPERAVATAFSRAAQSSCALTVYPSEATLFPATLAELAEHLPERGLIQVVENGAGALGVVMLCPSMLSAVIEIQSMGRVSARARPERRPTRTDAAICADFVNTALSELARELSLATGTELDATYRFASFVEDTKPLELMLEDIAYRGYRLKMKLGREGRRDALMLAILPDDLPAAKPGSAPATAGQGAIGADRARSLAAAVRDVPVDLSAILCRRRMTLGELRALSPGSVLSLPPDAVGNTRLELSDGQLIARGKLGMLNGCRAIRIAAPLAEQGRQGAKPGIADAPADFETVAEGLPGEANVFSGDLLPRTGADVDAGIEDPILADLEQPDPFRDSDELQADHSGDEQAMPLSFAVK